MHILKYTFKYLQLCCIFLFVGCLFIHINCSILRYSLLHNELYWLAMWVGQLSMGAMVSVQISNGVFVIVFWENYVRAISSA